jgi:uncharacterized protein Veg
VLTAAKATKMRSGKLLDIFPRHFIVKTYILETNNFTKGQILEKNKYLFILKPLKITS